MKPRVYRRHGFAQRYKREDVELLATLDTAHGTLSAPVRRSFYTERTTSSEKRIERLAGLSVAQLYRLRKSCRYREQQVTYSRLGQTKCQSGSDGDRSRGILVALDLLMRSHFRIRI